MNKKHGFTLIELLIVVAIIAILAAIAVPNFLEAQVRTKVSRVKADQRSLATACEAYVVDNNITPVSETQIGYPPITLPPGIVADLNADGTNGSPTGNSTDWLWSFWTTPIAYMSSVPVDPFAITGRVDQQKGGAVTAESGRQYTYYMFLSSVAHRIDGTEPTPMPAAVKPMLDTGVTWTLYSWGPSRSRLPGGSKGTDASKVAGHLPSSGTQWLYPDALYDPSNGTTSWGMLMRTSRGVEN